MSDRPFFSVIVPTYNRANIILQTLSNILNQTFSDFEIIIVDDGSTDNTTEVLQDADEVRIKLIRQENKERGAARNNGIKNARGMYVVLFDSDDVMHKNHLEVLNKNILEQQNPDFIATKFDFTDENGNHSASDMKNLKQGYYDYRLFLDGNPLACNICIRKDNPELFLFEEDRKYAIKEDWMFMLQNFQSHKLFIIDDTTISMLDHKNRSMRSDNNLIIRKTLLALEWIVEKIKLSKEEIKQLHAHVNYFCGIHSYLENNRKDTISYSISALRYGGMKTKYLLLLMKSVPGKKVISLFR